MMHEIAPRQPSRWARFTERCYRAGIRQQLQELRYGGAGVLASLIADLEASLDPAFERELARRLGDPDYRDMSPATLLLPVMRERFGLDPVVAEAPEGRALKTTCEDCPAAGRCWQALRHGATATQCQGFCPNAPSLIREAAEAH